MAEVASGDNHDPVDVSQGIIAPWDESEIPGTAPILCAPPTLKDYLLAPVKLPIHLLFWLGVMLPMELLPALVDLAARLSPAPIRKFVRGGLHRELRVETTEIIEAPADQVWLLIEPEGRRQYLDELMKYERQLGPKYIAWVLRELETYEAVPMEHRVVIPDWTTFSWRTRLLRLFRGTERVLLAEPGYGTCPLPWRRDWTRFEQRIRFEGLLVALFGGMLERETRAGFERSNRELKTKTKGRVS